MKHKQLHFASLSTGKKHHAWWGSLGAVRRTQSLGCSGPATAAQRGQQYTLDGAWAEPQASSSRLPARPQPPFCSLYWSARGIPRISRGGESPSLPFTGTRQKRPAATAQTRSGGTQSQQRERGLSIGGALSSCSKVSSGPVRRSRAQKERLEGQDKKV